MKYLVDTDWVIDYLNDVNRTVLRLDDLMPDGVGMSIVSLAEIYEGVFRGSDPQGAERQLQNFLNDVAIVPLDDAICRIFALDMGRLRAAGFLTDNFDLLIGSTAIRHDLTLLTNNRRHFERLQGLSIISA